MFFSESANFSYTSNIPASNIGLTPDFKGFARMQELITEDWFNLREKMMKCEHKAIITEDALLLEAGAGDFFKKIADWFKKLIAYIKEIFNKFVVWFDSKVRKDADFVKKYEKIVMQVKLDKFEYTGRSWIYGDSISAVKDGLEKMFSEVNKAGDKVKSINTDQELTALKDKFGDNQNEYLYNIINGTNDKQDFDEKVQESFFKDGNKDPQTLNTSYIDLRQMLDTIKDSKKNTEAAKKAKDAMEKYFGHCENNFNKIATELSKVNFNKDKDTKVSVSYKEKDGDNKTTGDGKYEQEYNGDKSNFDANVSHRNIASSAATFYAGVARSAANISNGVFADITNAIKARNTEFRSVIAKVVTYKAPKSESYNFFDESTGILDQF